MTLASFKTYVKYDWKRSDKDTELVQAYNDMIIYISTLIPHSGYKFISYVLTVAQQVDYPMPTTLVHLLHPIKILEGNASGDSGFQLIQITKKEFDKFEPNPFRTNPSGGEPGWYCIYARSIMLTPIPDKVYLLEINWMKKPTAQSDNADTHSLGSEWDEVLKQGTLSRLYAGIGLYDEAAYWRSMYEDNFGNPAGMLRRLLDLEKDRESLWCGQIINNEL